MRILDITLTGLFTTPTPPDSPRFGDDSWCAMGKMARDFGQGSLQEGHAVTRIVFAWDGQGLGDGQPATPDGICRRILEACTQHKDGPFDRIILRAHSFGGALLILLCAWLARWHSGRVRFDQAIVLDPAPNGVHFGDPEWINADAAYAHNHARWGVDEDVAPNVLVFFQKAGRPIGVKGVPLFERSGVLNVDLSDRRHVRLTAVGLATIEDWGQGDPFDHCSMIQEPRVRAMALARCRLACGMAA